MSFGEKIGRVASYVPRKVAAEYRAYQAHKWAAPAARNMQAEDARSGPFSETAFVSEAMRRISITPLGTRADRALLKIEQVTIAALPVTVTASTIMDSVTGTGTFSIGKIIASLAYAGFSAAYVAFERHATLHLGSLTMGFWQGSELRPSGQRFSVDVHEGPFVMTSWEKPQKPRWNSSLSLFRLAPLRAIALFLSNLVHRTRPAIKYVDNVPGESARRPIVEDVQGSVDPEAEAKRAAMRFGPDTRPVLGADPLGRPFNEGRLLEPIRGQRFANETIEHKDTNILVWYIGAPVRTLINLLRKIG
jgi:hypothetical protein